MDAAREASWPAGPADIDQLAKTLRSVVHRRCGNVAAASLYVARSAPSLSARVRIPYPSPCVAREFDSTRNEWAIIVRELLGVTHATLPLGLIATAIGGLVLDIGAALKAGQDELFGLLLNTLVAQLFPCADGSSVWVGGRITVDEVTAPKKLPTPPRQTHSHCAARIVAHIAHTRTHARTPTTLPDAPSSLPSTRPVRAGDSARRGAASAARGPGGGSSPSFEAHAFYRPTRRRIRVPPFGEPGLGIGGAIVTRARIYGWLNVGVAPRQPRQLSPHQAGPHGQHAHRSSSWCEANRN
jgi:hypothetical protein